MRSPTPSTSTAPRPPPSLTGWPGESLSAAPGGYGPGGAVPLADVPQAIQGLLGLPPPHVLARQRLLVVARVVPDKGRVDQRDPPHRLAHGRGQAGQVPALGDGEPPGRLGHRRDRPVDRDGG